MSSTQTIAKSAALLAGVVISLLAGYISVTGLHSLFPAGGLAVLAMGAAMEVGKVVSVAAWRHTTGLLRAGLAALVLLLTSITALGVYGFLSSAHLTDKAPGVAATVQVDRLAAELELARAEQAQAEDRLRRLDAAVDALPADWISRKQALRQSQAAERAEVQATLTTSLATQRRIIEAQAEARTAQHTSEASPLRYAAEALGLDDEQVAKLVILLLLMAFDPLGLALVAAGSGSALKKQAATPVAVRKPRPARKALGRGLEELQAEKEKAPAARPPLRIVS